MMQYFSDCGKFLAESINKIFGDREPWQIATLTASGVISLHWLWNTLIQDECLYERSKKCFFSYAKKIPYVRAKVEAEIDKINSEFQRNTLENTKDVTYLIRLPEKGLNYQEISKKVDQHLNLGSYDWRNGRVSGAVYYYNEDLIKLTTEVYGKASYTNPLHADLFPGICKMESEVVRITATLFNGGPSVCGTMTTGGTESLLMACKAYRDYAKANKGITKPNIVAATSVHAAIDKAGQYFGIHIKSIKINEKTMAVDVRAMESAINRNTIMLVGSAPNFPYGTMDDIEAIAKLGKKYNIPVHVDACLGGFVIVFMKKAGYKLPPFDFSIDGVTSISVDPHKYGFTPKGSSVILYSDKKYRHYQYTVTTDWPGGVYGSPTVNGSRAGGVIAACWAALMSFGEEGYIEATKSIVDTARYIENELRKIKGLFIFGTPATTVVAMGSHDFDIFRLSDMLCHKGWNLNALQFPSGIHFTVTYMHTVNGIAEAFVKDVKLAVNDILKNPSEKVEGKMAIYGVAQSVPDRSLVGDFTKAFIDSMYYVPPEL
ncbi:sphingosine-1-phosphate lyase [Condylostylus longicornis]|uniref:sphingosine-1-phosphate lyase n=1 Tax=Condylostylus longicornis TaxID=2530218 RepID=UPI00244E16F2|nr:sphingosine-1-phosphate lyase [Condylostylus longicornis]